MRVKLLLRGGGGGDEFPQTAALWDVLQVDDVIIHLHDLDLWS